VPYVRGLDLQDGYIDTDQLWQTSPEIAERYRRSELEAGDVLLNIIRHTRVAVVPAELTGANISRTTARLRPGPYITSAFLSHWVASHTAQSWLASRMRGIDMPGLNLRDVRQLPVPMPPIAEQDAMTARLDEVKARADALTSSFERLEHVLPGLEADLIESFAYGSSADAISRRTPDEVQGALSMELLDSLAAARMSASAEATSVDHSETSTNGAQEVRVQPARTGRASTNPNEVIEALETLGGMAAPADLYRTMKLTEAAVDSFYDALRDLVRSRRLLETRPDDTNVTLKIVARK
jgi:type I restriction enzyme S subunit